MIYAIEAVGLDRVKFGRAKNPASRIRELSTGSPVPLRLVAAVGWHDEKERFIHAAFAEFRLAGEWFSMTGRVSELVRTMMSRDMSEEDKYVACSGLIADGLHRHNIDWRTLSGPREKPPNTSAVPAATRGQASPDPGNARIVNSPGPAGVTSPDQPSAPAAAPMSDGRTTPLTPAEKQRRHREKMGDEGRKRDRERKQRKRGQ